MRQVALLFWAGSCWLPQPANALAPAIAGARIVSARALEGLKPEAILERSEPSVQSDGDESSYSDGKAEAVAAAAVTVARRPFPISSFPTPGFDTSEVLTAVMYARKSGPHHWKAWNEESASANIRRLLSSASAVDWYFLGGLLVLLLITDMVILQQLPETIRTHVILLLFWVLVAVAFCMETWLRLGQESGTRWLTGYFLEVVFSIDSVFVTQLIFCSFQTPRRLTAKAMFMGLLGSLIFRFAFFLGLASVLNRLRFVPYLLGILLVYCGITQVTASRTEPNRDVTQTATVQAFRWILGDRLGDFYDEEREALFAVAGQKLRMTLLGVVVAGLLAMNFLLGVDVVLTKAERFDNAYLNFSSSAVAVFGIRALFFVARDVFNRFSLTKYGIGFALLLVGTEVLLARSVYVNALMSSTITVLIMILSVGLSSLRGLTTKSTS